jgi:hypothetical protein
VVCSVAVNWPFALTSESYFLHLLSLLRAFVNFSAERFFLFTYLWSHRCLDCVDKQSRGSRVMFCSANKTFDSGSDLWNCFACCHWLSSCYWFLVERDTASFRGGNLRRPQCYWPRQSDKHFTCRVRSCRCREAKFSLGWHHSPSLVVQVTRLQGCVRFHEITQSDRTEACYSCDFSIRRGLTKQKSVAC